MVVQLLLKEAFSNDLYLCIVYTEHEISLKKYNIEVIHLLFDLLELNCNFPTEIRWL